MQKRTLLVGAVLSVLGLALFVSLRRDAGPELPSELPLRATPEPALDPPPLVESSPEPPAPRDPGAAQSSADRLRAKLLDRRVKERSREVQREQLAKVRFDEALDASGLSAEDVDVSVRELFRRMELKSVLDADGMLLGLRIETLDTDSPLAALGFQPGDQIERLDYAVLRDPADLPTLIAGLRSRVRVCASRGGEEICGDVDLTTLE